MPTIRYFDQPSPRLKAALDIIAADLYSLADAEIPRITKGDPNLGMTPTAKVCGRASHIAVAVLNAAGFEASVNPVITMTPAVRFDLNPEGRNVTLGTRGGMMLPSGWGGHAVVIVNEGEDSYLFDPTIGQARRDYLPSNWPDMFVARICETFFENLPSFAEGMEPGTYVRLIARDWGVGDKILVHPRLLCWHNPHGLKLMKSKRVYDRRHWWRVVQVLGAKVSDQIKAIATDPVI